MFFFSGPHRAVFKFIDFSFFISHFIFVSNQTYQYQIGNSRPFFLSQLRFTRFGYVVRLEFFRYDSSQDKHM